MRAVQEQTVGLGGLNGRRLVIDDGRCGGVVVYGTFMRKLVGALGYLTVAGL